MNTCLNCNERIVPVYPGGGWNHVRDGQWIWACANGTTTAELQTAEWALLSDAPLASNFQGIHYGSHDELTRIAEYLISLPCVTQVAVVRADEVRAVARVMRGENDA